MLRDVLPTDEEQNNASNGDDARILRLLRAAGLFSSSRVGRWRLGLASGSLCGSFTAAAHSFREGDCRGRYVLNNSLNTLFLSSVNHHAGEARRSRVVQAIGLVLGYLDMLYRAMLDCGINYVNHAGD